MVHESQWRGANDAYFYHYTSIQNAQNILRQKLIHVSKARLKKFGRGVFMTVLKPSESTAELLSNNYRGNAKFTRKTECAFAIPKRALNPTKLYDPCRDVWRNDTPIDLTSTDYCLILRGHSEL